MTISLMQLDESDSGGSPIVAIEGLPELFEGKEFDAVRHSCYGHEVTHLGLMLGIRGVMERPLANYHSHVGDKVPSLGVWLPSRPPSGPAPLHPLSIRDTDCKQLISPGVKAGKPVPVDGQAALFQEDWMFLEESMR